MSIGDVFCVIICLVKGRGSMANVSLVKGIGPKSLSLLNKIGINTIDDNQYKTTSSNY